MSVHRLAFGLEPRDAVAGWRIGAPLRVLRDDPAPGRELRHLATAGGRGVAWPPGLDRHATGRHALRYAQLPDVAPAHVDVRLVEAPGGGGPRRFVPRRLRLPLVEPAGADARATGFRVRRPRLFPGAAYPLPSRATGLRGRVLRSGEPARWARIEAVRPGSDDVLGRAHGDDRGEFLLVLAASARGPGSPEATLAVEVRVSVSHPPPVATPTAVAGADPLWDLPLEEVPDGEHDDPVTLGEALPDGYGASATRELELPLGRVLTAVDPFEP